MPPFYLGKQFDLSQGKTLDQVIGYDPADLTTHGFVVGMTGSGKTGLCIDLLEEAALNQVPAIIVDPKGDLTNLLLHFPNLAPADFQPWIDPEAARRSGEPVETVAAETAAMWRNGLAQWDIQPDRIQALSQAASFAIYTPGSEAGLPVSILASLKAPALSWDSNKEGLRDKIGSTVIALLGLVGYKDIDPVRSREHILLSNIFENAWSQGRDLDLTELILQTQTPPFDKLGVFPVDKFFPPEDRFQLAMLLNNFMAAPSFQAWIEGLPLDPASLLYNPDGSPRHSVFYLAHLDETERMFFVTLLFSAVEAWMRTQPGTTGLKAILYFDEIAGYLPPVGNPPSKTVLLRMLKQARAFGVGLLLASQNPVDIDYKALSNAGTWLIGKLQTDQDKQRLLDGLEAAAGGIDRSSMDKLISNLGKRVFLLHNVHAKAPIVFQTRWSMNYLAGPLTRVQIPALNRLAEAHASATPVAATTPAQPAAQNINVPPASPVSFPQTPNPVAPPPVQAPAPPAALGSQTRPAVPSGVDEYFFPNNLTLSEALQSAGKSMSSQAKNLGLMYRPALAAQMEIRYIDRRYNLDFNQQRAALVHDPDRRGAIRWDDHLVNPINPQNLDTKPTSEARFASLDLPFTDARSMTTIQKDFQDWVYRTTELKLRSNPTLKVFSQPGGATADFQNLCNRAAQQAGEAELDKVSGAYDRKLAALQDKLERAQQAVEKYQDQLSQRRMEEVGSGIETVMGLFGGRKRRVTTTLSKHRMSEQTRSNVESNKKLAAELQKDVAALQAEKSQAL
ncbi:MAG: type IV secretion system DNA-binding domain-containing protein, partial [Anaerolineaceae bacterium]|nr:type IV secretion system DNA-binding domain-containing protein [Anaerolineaceae bacterium]